MNDHPKPELINAHWVERQLLTNLNRVLNPAVGPALLRELARPGANFQSVAGLLQGDPYLAARTLAFAELTRQPEDQPLRDLEDAARRLGLKQVESIVLSVMLLGPIAENAPFLRQRPDVWAWSLACGVAGGLLGPQRQDLDPTPNEAAAMLDGLLLPLGVLVMTAGIGWPYHNTLGTTVRPAVLADDELDQFGITHHRVTLWALDALNCRPELGRYPRALDPRDRWDTPDALFGQCIELFGAILAGALPQSHDAFLLEHLPAFGIDPGPFIRQSLPTGKQRLTKLMNVFEQPADPNTHRDTAQRAAQDLAQRVQRDLTARRSA